MLLDVQVLQNIWSTFLVFFSKLIAAIVIFLIGWFVALGVGKIVTEILRKLQLNKLFEKESWKLALEKAELNTDVAGFIGAIVKWIFVIVFLLVSVEVLGLKHFAEFLSNILGYLPNVVVAALIFVVAVIIAEFLEKLVRVTVEGMKVGYGGTVGAIVKWSIWVFAILAILLQLQIANQLIITLFTGFVALVTIAGGLAFGLGGKDLAAEILEKLKNKLKQ